jgi:hypothetical protein
MEGLDITEHGGNAYPDFSGYGGIGANGGSGMPLGNSVSHSPASRHAAEQA